MAVRPKAPLLFGINKLRAEANFSPYLPKAGAPGWISRLAGITHEDLGALAILGPSGISIASSAGRARVVPDPLSLYITALSNRIRGTGRRVAIGLPPSARHLPLLLASSAMLKSTLERARGSTRAGGVLVISRDLDIRSRYCDVYVNKELLDDAHPGSRMRPDGQVITLLPHGAESLNYRGVCFFLPELTLPERVNLTPSLILLDLRYARWVKRAENLSKWVKDKSAVSGALALYTIGDFESASALSKAGFTDIPFDHAAVATCICQVGWSGRRPEQSVDLSFTDAPLYLARTHTIEEVSASEGLGELFSANARLLYHQHKQENPDLNRARWLLAVLSHMPVPLQWYESTVHSLGRSTLKRLIELLGVLSRRERGMGAVVQTTRMHLQQLYTQMMQDNPRPDALKSVIARMAQKITNKMLILVRDRTMSQALDSWLAVEACPGADWLPKVDVRSYDTYSEVAGTQYEAVLINGAVPRRYRWALGGALGKNVCFLAYSYESEIIEQHLLVVYGQVGLKNRKEMREKSVNDVLGDPTTRAATVPDSPIATLVLNRKRTHSKAAPVPKSIKIEGGFAGLSQAMNLARDRAEQEMIVARSAEQQPMEDDFAEIDDVMSGGGPVESPDQGLRCLSVKVHSRRHGRGRLWLPADSLIECVRPTAGEEIWRMLPRNLRVGDVLLRTETGEVRGSLFDQMVHLAEGQPEMDYLASFRRVWREAIQELALKNRAPWGIRYSDVFAALKAAGAPISSEQTVRLWMHDQVIGPEAVESIQAVGQVIGSSALVSHARRFDAAFRAIRAIHQGIGRRLSAAIRQSFHHLHFGETNLRSDRLDDRLGIPLDELVETVDLAEILSVRSTPENMASNMANRFVSEE